MDYYYYMVWVLICIEHILSIHSAIQLFLFCLVYNACAGDDNNVKLANANINTLYMEYGYSLVTMSQT